MTFVRTLIYILKHRNLDFKIIINLGKAMSIILSRYSKDPSHPILQIIVGVLFLSLCAQISIPLQPVPVTLQTLEVMLIALLYDMRIGLSIWGSYIILGAVGAPVFAEYGGGWQILVGPTGGYIIGFLICVYVMNKLKPILDSRKFLGGFLNCICGTIATYACGISWLALHVGGKKAILFGLVPFIIPDIVKALILTVLFYSLDILKGIKKSNTAKS